MPLTVETVETHLEHALNLLHGAQQELAHAEDTELILCLGEAIRRLELARAHLTERHPVSEGASGCAESEEEEV